MTKSIIAKVLAIAATVTVTASADQYNSSWGTISHMRSYGKALYVYGLNLSPNPAGCPYTDLARVQDSLSSAKIDGINRALLGAFLAGREVKVKLRSGECLEDRPVIYGVQVR
jgi:hypothetical protein